MQPISRLTGFTSILVAALLLSSCRTGDNQSGARATGDGSLIEAVSIQGGVLERPEIDKQREAEMQQALQTARQRFKQRPEVKERIIWYGRRLAYLGRFRDAVDVYSRGLRIYPDSPELLRHRGHRYITLRRFDEAIADLARAADLVRDEPDEVEPDGVPNRLNQPRSTLKTNIYYHLGLAHYLEGEWAQSIDAYRTCRDLSPNDDMRVASLYWLYLGLARTNQTDEARRVLAQVEPNMDIIENAVYHELLLMYKGEEAAGESTDPYLGEAVANATRAYGVGMKHYLDGDRRRARDVFQRIVTGDAWPAFGHIAAEAELARMGEGLMQ